MSLALFCSSVSKGKISFPHQRTYSTSFKHTSSQVRREFLEYFEKNGHKRFPSDTLIPSNDPTLLFTNAGMVQFKNFYLGLEKPQYDPITTVQKCVRVGGKHNDLENVGKTARHHTFFEMLGNFSFGSYGKEEAIHLAWNFLTKQVQLPKEKLRVTVYKDDEEAVKIWNQQVGLPLDRILRCGKEDNFWSMGEGKGPCGPCTEIFYHQEKPDSDGEHWLEVWNLVFMQYSKNEREELTPLAKTCIDTGMGLERITSVLQGKTNNFDTDAFNELIAAGKSLFAKRTRSKNSNTTLSDEQELLALRVISDHLRSSSFLIADGVLPSNIGRGYVLRRIIRRAVRYANMLGISEPFLAELFPVLAHHMQDAYPELTERSSTICDILTQEETMFFRTLTQGLSLLQASFTKGANNGNRQLAPETVFQLYDTYGFPLDLTNNIAAENGWKIDENSVAQLIEKQRQQSRASWKGSGDSQIPEEVKRWKDTVGKTSFVGYDHSLLNQYSDPKGVDCVIKAIAQPENHNQRELWISIEPCPFYPESGGQDADSGRLQLSNGVTLNVKEAIKAYEHGIALRIQESDESKLEGLLLLHQIAPGVHVKAFVDTAKRFGAARHHTATHLLQAALRNISKTIVQAGSSVSHDRLRFDFTYANPLTKQQLKQVEDWVNEAIQKDIELNTLEMNTKEAMESGAMSLFGEKYGSSVRVVDVPGHSKELCGGTHVHRTGQIGLFKIISEKSLAAGIRRIEAVTGNQAVEWYREQYDTLERIADMFDVKPFQLEKRLEKVKLQRKELEKEIQQLQQRTAKSQEEEKGIYNNSIPTFLQVIDSSEDINMLRERANQALSSHSDGILVFVSFPKIIVAVSQPLQAQISAGKWMQELFKYSPGRGGGSNQMAQGNFTESSSEKTLATIRNFCGVTHK